ncbi:hypothetical protein [Janibacter limosus]|uniref:hypothetical protein n=1 Tax=Janibacter limosus TaxID=53458 RepID=UPI00082D5F66|nr:hypothetical protein [Janibacter limosus]
MAVLAVDLLLVLGIVRMTLGSREHFVRDLGLLSLVVATLVMLVGLVIASLARRSRYDIHQHGLALRGRDDVVEAFIPWETIDPGRVLISAAPRQVSTWTPRGLLEWAARPPLVLINGPVCRPNNQPHSRDHRYSTDTDTSPFGWWQLGVTDPLHLLTAIESAMVADGHCARGLTAAALARQHPAGPATDRAARGLARTADDANIGIRPKAG